MAFAAIHPIAGRIDATLSDLGCGLTWSLIYKVRPRVALRCTDCGYGVHAKVSARNLRHFAHDPGRPADCAWLNESFEHHMLKLELVTRIRDVGWHAELEVRADDGSWRADVLASAHDGSRRMAWEAQLSPITNDDIRERTRRYADEQIDVCWVSPAESSVPWLSAVPAIRVQKSQDGRSLSIVDGVARFDFREGSWIQIEDLDLTQFIAWALRQQASPHQVLPRYRRILSVSRNSYARRSQIWTTPRSIGEEARHEAMRAHQDMQKKQREEQEAARHEAQRLEAERARQAQKAAYRASIQALERQWALDAERHRQLRAAEERERQRQAAVLEEQRQREEKQERQAADQWWADLSTAQIDELRDVVAEAVWAEKASRAVFDTRGVHAENAYGIGVYVRHRPYAILRPSPASLHRLVYDDDLIFVRNQREAHQIHEATGARRLRIIHFDLPDHEQMILM